MRRAALLSLLPLLACVAVFILAISLGLDSRHGHSEVLNAAFAVVAAFCGLSLAMASVLPIRPKPSPRTVFILAGQCFFCGAQWIAAAIVFKFLVALLASHDSLSFWSLGWLAGLAGAPIIGATSGLGMASTAGGFFFASLGLGWIQLEIEAGADPFIESPHHGERETEHPPGAPEKGERANDHH